MKKTVLLLVLAALATAAYFYREQIADHMPANVAAYMGKAENNAASDTPGSPRQAGGKEGAGAAGNQGGRPQGQGQGRRGSGGPVAVKIAVANIGSLPILRESFGYIEAKDTTSLAGPLSGIVRKIHVQDGADVKAGDIIVSLDDRALVATLNKDMATLAKDQAAYENAMRTAKRTANLGVQGASAQQNVDNAQAAVAQTQAAVTIDQAQIEADKVAISNLQIKAPYDGKLGAILVSEGSYAQAGSPVALIVNMKDVFAQFTLPETDLNLIRQSFDNKALHASVTPTRPSEDTQELEGPVAFIDNKVDEASGTFKLWAALDNSEKRLWPGESVSVKITVGAIDNLVLVPSVALVLRQDGTSVYVVGADDKAELRKVNITIRNGEMVGVSDGLAVGDKVIIEGQQSLQPGSPIMIDDGKTKPANGNKRQGGKRDGAGGGENGNGSGKPPANNS